MESLWLRAVDCPLLQTGNEPADPLAFRLVQRLLEMALVQQRTSGVAAALLEEIATALRADQATIWEAVGTWHLLWQHSRRGLRVAFEPPSSLLGEVLDREAGVSVPPTGNQPALLATCLSFIDRPNRVLVVHRPREPFERTELEYAVGAGHFLGVALEKGRAWDQMEEKLHRFEALAEINRQLAQEKETVPLLEHIAQQAAKLLDCERASIFVWDRSRRELVGRPALGLPNGELRLPEGTGIVGKVVHTGQVQQVDDVRQDPNWHGALDSASGFQTRNLLCVPLNAPGGDRLGALEVMNKKGHFSPEDVVTLQALAAQVGIVLGNVREHEALLRSHHELEGQARLASRIVGNSTAIVALRGTVDRVARTDLPVLILGESGTGKEVVAKAIHYSSPRTAHPFIPVNCAAIAETLLESELFGHEKGAFTDAHATRAGKFEAASGGTLFLDEIGDLSAGGQAKLLRVLEEKAVYRVGSSQPIPVDTRIVAATNRNLAEAVRAGKFREDLFYRLSVVTVDLPPLRERREDVLILADHFLHQFSKEAGRKPLKFSADARKRLEQHDWPGNVRELRNLIERIAYLAPGDKVESSDLAFILRPGKDDRDPYAQLTLNEATDAFQRDHIEKTIHRANNNVSEAAKMLGLHRPNLYRKMKMLGMNP
jgi:transcriptional regulator with GAF, ATPase, and Fis domain